MNVNLSVTRRQRQFDNSLHQSRKADAGLACRLSELVVAVEIGIGIGFEDDDLSGIGETDIDAAEPSCAPRRRAGNGVCDIRSFRSNERG